jgi:NAD(P)-dependent dehydrogenase (short-subunit alcohol dehydrogenase family)
MIDPGAVIVTGASSGLGFAIATRLARSGKRVIAAVRDVSRNLFAGTQHSELIRVLPLEVSKPESIDSFVHVIAESESSTGITALINNAGCVVWGPLESITPEKMREQFEINVFGVHALTRALLPQLRRSGGRVINVGSISGRMVAPMFAPYAASKAALASLTDALNVELRPWHLFVSLIEAGRIETPLWSKANADTLVSLDPELHSIYQPSITTIRSRLMESRGLSADAAAAQIERILNDRRPKARYLLGRDANRIARVLSLPVALRRLFVRI